MDYTAADDFSNNVINDNYLGARWQYVVCRKSNSNLFLIFL